MTKRRRRNRKKGPSWSRATLVLLVTIAYLCLFIAPLMMAQYSKVNVGHSELVTHLAMDVFIVFAQVYCLLLGLAIHPFIWFITWIPVCLFTAMSNYMVNTYQSEISKDAIAVFVEVTGREVGTFLTLDLVIALAYGAALALFGIALMTRQDKQPKDTQKSAVALLLAIALVALHDGKLSTRYPPYNLLTNGVEYLNERYTTATSTRKNIAEYQSSYTPAGGKPLVIVMMIGESSRGDHYHINGYGRQTTPLIEQRKNLVNFYDATSCGVWTRVSVPCIMTRATAADKSPIEKETSLVSLFRSLGFETAWFAAQGHFSPADPTTAVSKEAEKRIVLEEHQYLDNTIKDEQLLPLVDAMLRQQTKPMLLVLHMYGSHWQYSARYPKSFEVFKPVCGMTLNRNLDISGQVNEIKDCSKDQQMLINAYDNSILYTDYMIDQVIKRLENANALLVFTTDHGESLGEGGRYLHGYENARENTHVALMWWASDHFIAANAQGWQALVQKSSSSSSHDAIFHSVLDCAGVRSELINPALSLCQAAPPPVQEQTHDQENQQRPPEQAAPGQGAPPQGTPEQGTPLQEGPPG